MFRGLLFFCLTCVTQEYYSSSSSSTARASLNFSFIVGLLYVSFFIVKLSALSLARRKLRSEPANSLLNFYKKIRNVL